MRQASHNYSETRKFTASLLISVGSFHSRRNGKTLPIVPDTDVHPIESGGAPGAAPHPKADETQPSGRVHIQLPVTPAAITGTITHGQGAKIMASTILTAKAAVAAILPLRLMAPLSRHAAI